MDRIDRWRRQIQLMAVRGQRQVASVEGGHLFLKISAGDGGLHHAETPIARIALVFHAADAGEPHLPEECRRGVAEFLRMFPGGCATGGAPNAGRPRADLSTWKRAHHLPLPTDVLKTEIDVAIPAFDPLLHHHVGQHRLNLAVERIHLLGRRHLVGLLEARAVLIALLAGLQHAGVVQRAHLGEILRTL
ncbi:hypothetical protein D9M69_574930 [compost metagenome]